MTSSETTFNDAELIARLRDAVNGEHDMTPHGADVLQAVARIEALTKERDQHWDSFVHWHKQADDLTGQLAAARQDAKEAEAYAWQLEQQLGKAVETLKVALRYNNAMHGGAGAYNKRIKDFIAELKGHDDE